MTTSLAQAVAHVLAAADRPLTVDEIGAQVRQAPGRSRPHA
jgi:hypothetical protein